MLIPCPHCGTRPVEEFTFLGDASVKRPASNDPSSMEQWYDYVYLRNKPKVRFDEFVRHSGGCRASLVISRDTETHEVFGCVTVRDYGKTKGGKA